MRRISRVVRAVTSDLRVRERLDGDAICAPGSSRREARGVPARGGRGGRRRVRAKQRSTTRWSPGARSGHSTRRSARALGQTRALHNVTQSQSKKA